MHQNTLSTLLGLFFALNISISYAQPIGINTSVMSYNIHLEDGNEQAWTWDQRKSTVSQVLTSRSPEIIGLQGASLHQLSFLENRLKDYNVYTPEGVALEFGTDLCPIMFDSSVYELIESGTESFEPSLLKKPSKKILPFINWVHLIHIESQSSLYVFNSHINYHQIKTGKSLSDNIQELVAERTQGAAFFLLFDIKDRPEDRTSNSISEWAYDSFETSLVNTSELEDTYFGWHEGGHGTRQDFVYASGHVLSNSYQVLGLSINGMFPSDHLPVYCKARIDIESSEDPVAAFSVIPLDHD